MTKLERLEKIAPALRDAALALSTEPCDRDGCIDEADPRDISEIVTDENVCATCQVRLYASLASRTSEAIIRSRRREERIRASIASTMPAPAESDADVFEPLRKVVG